MSLVNNLKNNIIFKILLISVFSVIIWVNITIFSLIITKIEPMYSGMVPNFKYPNLFYLILKILPIISISLGLPILFAKNKMKSTWLFFTLLIVLFSLIHTSFNNRESLFLQECGIDDSTYITEDVTSETDTTNILNDTNYVVFSPSIENSQTNINSLDYDALSFISKMVFKAFKTILKVEILISFLFFGLFSLIILNGYTGYKKNPVIIKNI